jgi:hypothetical protein
VLQVDAASHCKASQATQARSPVLASLAITSRALSRVEVCSPGKSEVRSAGLTRVIVHTNMNLRVHSQGGIVIPGLHGRTQSNGAPISHQHDIHCQSRHRGIVFGAEWRSMQQRTRLHANRCGRRRVTRAEAVAILAIEQALTSLCIFGSSHQRLFLLVYSLYNTASESDQGHGCDHVSTFFLILMEVQSSRIMTGRRRHPNSGFGLT